MEPARLSALLARTPGLTARQLNAAGAGCDSPDDLLRRLLEGPLPGRARSWLQCPDERLIDTDLRWMQANRGQILTCLDPAYPLALACLDPAPPILYVCGDAGALRAPALAIVGSRHAGAAVLASARGLAGDLARAGVCIVSSLEEGIDTAAHEGALEGAGTSVAVSATGLDRIYPARSAGLAQRIRERGCLVSLVARGTPPLRHHFPVRNRLIAALGLGTLVVETSPGTGSWGTAVQARRLQRRVFAVPGSIRDPAARSCNQLIREGATLVQQSSEILQDLNLDDIQTVTMTAVPRPGPRSVAPPLDNKYEMLLDAAGFEPVDIDVLVFRTGWSGPTVTSMLLLLELQGRVAPQPGGRYCRLS